MSQWLQNYNFFTKNIQIKLTLWCFQHPWQWWDREQMLYRCLPEWLLLLPNLLGLDRLHQSRPFWRCCCSKIAQKVPIQNECVRSEEFLQNGLSSSLKDCSSCFYRLFDDHFMVEHSLNIFIAIHEAPAQSIASLIKVMGMFQNKTPILFQNRQIWNILNVLVVW